jgi:hypothetical protein
MVSHRVQRQERSKGPAAQKGNFVSALLIVGVVIAVPVLYAADRIMKARAQARRKAEMGERLAAAAAKGERQHQRQEQAAEASAALTSVIPAINRPPLPAPSEPAPVPPRDSASRQPVARESSEEPVTRDLGLLDPAHPEARPEAPEREAREREAPGPEAPGPEAPGRDAAAHVTGHAPARPRPGCGRTAQQDHTHLRRASRTGEHMVRSPGRP